MNLAAAMAAAEGNLRDAERSVETLLTRMFPAWKGWRFTAPHAIDVWQCQDSPGAAVQLRRVGFRTITLHDHRAERFLSCRCRVRELP